MAFVSTYLNFMGQTEEAFNFYADAFGTQDSLKIMRFSDMPATPGAPEIPENELNMVLHAELTIIDDHILMATDMLESMGHKTQIGNNTTISLNVDSRDEADRLFGILSQSSEQKAGMMEMPYGYWGTALDKYGIRWMFNFAPREN